MQDSVSPHSLRRSAVCSVWGSARDTHRYRCAHAPCWTYTHVHTLCPGTHTGPAANPCPYHTRYMHLHANTRVNMSTGSHMGTHDTYTKAGTALDIHLNAHTHTCACSHTHAPPPTCAHTNAHMHQLMCSHMLTHAHVPTQHTPHTLNITHRYQATPDPAA